MNGRAKFDLIFLHCLRVSALEVSRSVFLGLCHSLTHITAQKYKNMLSQ